MNRTVRLLHLLSECEKVEGRKKLQKTVHILKSVGCPLEYKYSFYLHGPFSAELKDDIDRLVDFGLLSEIEGEKGNYKVFEYQATEAASELLKDLLIANSEDDWVGVCRELVGKSSSILEAMSTVLFIRDKFDNRNDLKIEFVRLKPKLEPLFDEAVRELSQFGGDVPAA